MAYNTKQKDVIMNVIKKQKKEFTIKDLYQELNGNVGLTTIYRFVDKLVKDNRLSKDIGIDNIIYYQYLEECHHENHFYLKCNNCGSMVHIDCDCIGELSSHIIMKHHFKPSKEHIIINGLCDKCIK
jgi:Fur family ferric uptake transcriptional regulator